MLKAIESIIASKGYSVLLYQATTCPCGNTPSSPNNTNCAACGSYGILYPSAPLSIMAWASDIDLTVEMDGSGYGFPGYGEMTLYPMPGNVVSNFDLVIFPTTVSFPTYSDVIERGSGTTDTADYTIAEAYGIWTVDVTTGVSTAYTPGVDFTTSGKTITWIGNTPPQGTQYSLRYSAQFEWIAYMPPTPRVGFSESLGQIVQLRKRHIILPNAPTLIAG